jgi:hypothetical protein
MRPQVVHSKLCSKMAVIRIRTYSRCFVWTIIPHE